MESSEEVIFKPKSKSAILPRRHSDGAAGYDLHSICSGTILPHTTLSLKLGFSLSIPSNILGYICGRSGLATKNGIKVLNSYAMNEEEIEIHLHNNLDQAFNFEKGSRIAQLFFARLATAKFVDQAQEL